MKIGIIGAGKIGGTLTRHFTELGHQVFVTNSRGPETFTDLAAQTGVTPVAGDDEKAKALVLKVVEELGFDGVDAGGLDDS